MLTKIDKKFLWLAVIGLAAMFAFLIHNGNLAKAQTSWTLVWSDEFNGSGQPSSSNWNYHIGNGFNPGAGTFDGWGNGEWEWYRPENCYQSGGNLVLKGEYRDTSTTIAGRQWYQFSCRITSDTKRSIQYGAIEAQIQMPNVYGTWPAFWMMGDACDDTSNGNYTAPITDYDRMASNWASCGEVDIMEHRNSDTTVINNLFWDTRTGLFAWDGPSVANNPSSPNVGNVATFHTYRLEWTSTQLKWLIDGNVTKTQDISPANMEEFRKPFHLIMNLAISGSFTGNAQPDKANFPTYVYVNYVRVYSAGGSTGGPSGYTFCANENGTCSFSGTASVAYGANGQFYYRTATGSIGCNNSTFGDPIPGTAKACYYLPTSTWSACANENGTCSFSGTMVVRYGANNTWAYKTATNSIACNNATFGDPTPGTAKVCYTAPVPSSGWTFCASENGTCNVPGTVTVAYGANSSWGYQTATNSIACNNATFGDPISGTVKGCYYR